MNDEKIIRQALCEIDGMEYSNCLDCPMYDECEMLPLDIALGDDTAENTEG